MKLIVIQYFGLGDVVWCQTLVHNLSKCDMVIWPVEGHLVEGLNRAYPLVFFVDRKKFDVDYNNREDYVLDGVRYLPLRWADTNAKVPYRECMMEKYRTYGMDYHIWKQQAMWVRNKEKEDALYKHLGLEEGQEYTLVNRFFGTNSQLVAPIQEKGIEMCTIPGYSIFDWTKVICNASQVHTVSTSILFMLELLDLNTPEIHIYARKPIEQNFDTVSYIFEKHKYIQHL